jgi:hypothetical protein
MISDAGVRVRMTNEAEAVGFIIKVYMRTFVKRGMPVGLLLISASHNSLQNQKYNGANTKSYQWTRSWGTSLFIYYVYSYRMVY